MLDLLIRNGYIADGTGSPVHIGDIGIKDGRIALMDSDIDIPAEEVIDGTGMVVAPGFIDLHSHSDFRLFEDPSGKIKLYQGVTTEINGNCGFSAAPVSEERRKLFQAYSEPILSSIREIPGFEKYSGYLEQLARCNPGYNTGSFIGNGTLRVMVKGFDVGPLSHQEITTVKKALEEALEAGAFGLSLGLMYAPENYYCREDLYEICKVLKKYGAILTAHIRGEGNSLLKSIEEVLDIAEKCEVPLHISHLKAAGRNNWGEMCDSAIGLIDNARGHGMDVTCDVYPYTAGSSTLASILPPWAMEGGIQRAIEKFRMYGFRQKLSDEMKSETKDWDNLVYSTGWENVVVSFVGSNDREVIGKSVADIAESRGEEPIDTVLNLLEKEQGNVAIVFYHMSEDDVIKIMKLGYSSIISDSLGSIGGMPHPRVYGTFPRLFARYVREKKVLTIEEAVRKVTSMPAQRLGLKSTGKLEYGYNADIVVFDPEKICDIATYTNPTQLSDGIVHVIVGGKQALKYSILTGVRNGRILIRKGN